MFRIPMYKIDNYVENRKEVFKNDKDKNDLKKVFWWAFDDRELHLTYNQKMFVEYQGKFYLVIPLEPKFYNQYCSFSEIELKSIESHYTDVELFDSIFDKSGDFNGDEYDAWRNNNTHYHSTIFDSDGFTQINVMKLLRKIWHNYSPLSDIVRLYYGEEMATAVKGNYSPLYMWRYQ